MYKLAILLAVLAISGCAIEIPKASPNDSGESPTEPQPAPEVPCDEGEESGQSDESPTAPEVLGTYETNFNSVANWTLESYSERGVAYEGEFTKAILEWDVPRQSFVAENAYGFVRARWHFPEESRDVWLCFEVLSGDSIEDARSAPPSSPTDPSDPDEGCNGAVWTILTPMGGEKA